MEKINSELRQIRLWRLRDQIEQEIAPKLKLLRALDTFLGCGVDLEDYK